LIAFTLPPEEYDSRYPYQENRFWVFDDSVNSGEVNFFLFALFFLFISFFSSLVLAFISVVRLHFTFLQICSLGGSFSFTSSE